MTTQCEEFLDFQGKRFAIAEQPLRVWLSENAEHIRFNHIDVSNFLPKRKAKYKARSEGTIKPLRFTLVNPLQGAFPFKFNTTACYRGYQGTWAIDGNRLYLTQIDGTLVDGRVATLADLFPDEPDRVFAHWFSGEIHGDAGKEFDRSLGVLLRFDKGMLIGQGAQGVVTQPPDAGNGDTEAKR